MLLKITFCLFLLLRNNVFYFSMAKKDHRILQQHFFQSHSKDFLAGTSEVSIPEGQFQIFFGKMTGMSMQEGQFQHLQTPDQKPHIQYAQLDQRSFHSKQTNSPGFK